MNRILLMLIVLLANAEAFSQDQDTTDLSELMNLKAETEATDLQKKLNENVGAASKKALASRETPSIVSVITEDDIRRAGARDLMDVLRLVPGFDFGTDVDFVIGLALRGAWSIEGKILVLFDGMELNELMYQNVAFFNRFPVDLIHRIEIIRGPGSAVYGGTAEYGVINIISKGANGMEGITAAAAYGALPDSYGRKNAQLGVVKNLSPNARFDFSLFGGKAVKSDQFYESLDGDTSLYLTNATVTNSIQANVGLKIKNFSVRTIFEDYKSADPHVSTQFKSFFLNVKNDFRINEKFTLTPFVYYSKQSPWKQLWLADNSPYFDNDATRIKGGLYGSYDFNRRMNVIVGTEYFHDYAISNLEPDYFKGSPDVSFNLYSFYAQALLKLRPFNITGGFRLDKHNAFGAAFVPRLALTKRINNLHFKALASGAYRAPGIDNINLSTDIRPEKSTVFEIELGYQLTPDMLMSLNSYSVKTRDIIVFVATDLGGGIFDEGYENSDTFGTKGVEFQYSFKKSRWNFDANFSFYQAGESTVDRYAVPGNTKVFVGIPQSKFTLIAGVDITKNMSFNTTVNSFGERFAYTQLDAQGSPQIAQLDAYTLLNANLAYNNLFTSGIFLSLGVYDLLNEKPSIPQAYNGDRSPLSGRSREVMVKLAYSIPFNKEK
jgi:outer membrane cobalamin receptor